MGKKRAIILGLGKSGRSAASFLLDEGASVLGIDRNAASLKEDPEIAPLLERAFLLQDENSPLSFEEVDCVIKSPGIYPTHPLVVRAAAEGKLMDEIDLGSRFLSQKGKKLFAITGTNGKTTTTALVTHIFNEAGLKAVSCGNIGNPILQEASLQELADYYIVEISSFQLWAMRERHFDAGVILNISPNHLDWHGSFSDYANTKWSLKERIKEEGVFFPPASFGKEIEERVESILSLGYRDGERSLRLGGQENIKAALALCQMAGIEDEAFYAGLNSFKKPPHRLEFVREKDGVSYINDSKATTIKAVEHAVTVCNAPLILIAGGIHKGDDFKKWIPLFRQKVKKIFAMGKDKGKIALALQNEVEVELVSDLHEAVALASKFAISGDTVLLSPGCSSFDEFRSYEHRGEVFRSIVDGAEV